MLERCFEALKSEEQFLSCGQLLKDAKNQQAMKYNWKRWQKLKKHHCLLQIFLLPATSSYSWTRSTVFLPENHCTPPSSHHTNVLLFHGNYFSCTPFPLLFPKNGPGLDATLFNTLLLPQNTEVVYLSHLFQKPISHHPFHPTLHSSGIVSWSFKCCTIFFYSSSYTTFLTSGFPSFQSSVPQDESQTAYFLKLSSVRSIFPCKSKLISVFSSLSL